MGNTRSNRLLTQVATAQGLFYIITGLWSLVSIDTFQAVTGPKTDLWLVKTVGAMLIVSGAVFLSAALRRRFSLEILVLAVGNATVLAAVDIIYSLQGRIPLIYLIDALMELIIIGAWIGAWLKAWRGR
ncbi:MAG: hypothetical protein ACOC3W_05540 [Thermodesulfobacteriota bacterium]